MAEIEEIFFKKDGSTSAAGNYAGCRLKEIRISMETGIVKAEYVKERRDVNGELIVSEGHADFKFPPASFSALLNATRIGQVKNLFKAEVNPPVVEEETPEA